MNDIVWCKAPDETWHMVVNEDVPCGIPMEWIGGPNTIIPDSSESCYICYSEWKSITMQANMAPQFPPTVKVCVQRITERPIKDFTATKASVDSAIINSMVALLQYNQEVSVDMFSRATAMYFSTGKAISKLKEEISLLEKHVGIYSNVMHKFIEVNPDIKKLIK